MIQLFDFQKPIGKELLKSIGVLDRTFFDSPWNENFYLSLANNKQNYLFIVAKDQDKLQGFAIFQLYDESSGELLKILVSPKEREKCWGIKLLGKGIDYLTTRNYEKLFLNVAIDNIAAMGLYEKYHFNISRQIKGFYRNGSDAFEMSLDL